MSKNSILPWMLVTFLGTGALLGCAEQRAIVDAYGQQAVLAKMQYNDKQRDLFAIGVCETTLGAHIRDPNPQRQMARECMCGGRCDAKVDLSVLLEAMSKQILSGSPQ